jgi:hypothetical protein
MSAEDLNLDELNMEEVEEVEEGQEQQQVSTAFFDAAPSQLEICSRCEREWNTTKHEDRASIVKWQQDGQNDVFCCTCVPHSIAPDIISHLTEQIYIANLQAIKSQDELACLQGKVAHLQGEFARLQGELQQSTNLLSDKEKALGKAFKQSSNLRSQLNAELDENIKLTAVLGRVRDQLHEVMAKARAGSRHLTGIPSTAKKMLEKMYSTCGKLYSHSRHTLRRLGLGRIKPRAPGLLEHDSVHTISIDVDKSGKGSMVFCTVCRGLDDGDHLAHQHSPRLAIVRLTGNAKQDKKALIKALAVPFDAQPVAMQTNDLAQSD